MDWDLKITDMAGTTPEHSSVIVNFVAAIRHQLKNSTCYVYSDNVQYRFKDCFVLNLVELWMIIVLIYIRLR